MTTRTRAALWLGVLLLLGAALRGLYLLTPALDSDQAIVGLMARHVLQGEFPIFFWGQPFAGTMEAHLAALLFFLFGPSRLTLALSPFLFSLAFLLVTYRLAREAFDDEVGLLALGLAALPAPFLVTHSVTARSNYIENLLLGSLVLCLALRVPREPGPRRRRALWLLGFFAGVAWYQSPQSIHYLAASALFLLLSQPRLVVDRALWAVLPAFVVGSLPLWASSLRGPSTFEAIFAHGAREALGRSLARYLGAKLPYVLGVTTREEALDLSIRLAVLGLHALAFLYLVYRWKSAGSRLLLLFLLTTSAVIVLAYNRGGGTRYLLPLYSALPVIMAGFLAALRRRNRALFAAALGGLLLANVTGSVARAEALDPKKLELYAWRRARDAQFFGWLESDGLTRVYVLDFWEAYRLTFDAGERIIFAEPIPSFYPPYTGMVDAAPRYAYVVRGRAAAQALEENLSAVGGGYRTREFAGYYVFDAFVPPAGPPLVELPRASWQATASHAPAEAARAIDGDPRTHWGTGVEAPPVYFQVDLGEVRTIGQLALLPGAPREAPRSLRIETSGDGERWQLAFALTASWQGLAWDGARLRVDASGRIQLRFPAVRARALRVTLLRAAGGGAWSIAELSVWEALRDPAAVQPVGPDGRARSS